MIKYFFSVLFLGISIIEVQAQLLPGFYKLQNEQNYSSKISSENPSSNSISDIITIGDTIWIGTEAGISLSTDRGQSWINFDNSSTFGGASASAIGYHNGIFWAATAVNVDVNGSTMPEGTGIKFTSDLGQTWNSIPQSVDAEGDSIVVYNINHIHALPITVAINNLTYDMAFTSKYIWTANFAGELRRANIDSLIANPNSKWERVVLPPDNLNTISPDDTLDFCLSPVSGNFCSNGNLNHRVFSVVAANDSTLYVGTAGGINKTTNADSLYPSWTKFNHQNQDYPISGNFIVALGYNNSTSTIWAASWKADDPTEFYAVSSSTDGGADWQTSLTDEQVHNFGFKFNSVIAVSDNGAFRTTDNGISWILPTSIIDKDTHLNLTTKIFYAAGSQDYDVWLGSADGLAKLAETPGSIWEGDWKIYFASQSLISKNETYPFPNPFSPRLDNVCKIKYSTGGKNVKVTIRIFDFGMNYVRTVIQNADRGNTLHNIDNASTDFNGVIDFWDGKDDNGKIVPNGVYFYRVDVGDDKPLYGKIIVLQ
jgi:hypothetical protein